MWPLILSAMLLDAPVDQSPTFVLDDIGETQHSGPLNRLSLDGTVQIGEYAVPLADVIAIRRQGIKMPGFPTRRPQVYLANGDRIPGTIVSIINDKVTIRADLGTTQDLSVLLSSVSAILFSETAAARAATASGQKLLAEPRTQDTAYLSNGDAIQGLLTSIDGAGRVRIEVAGKSIEVEKERLQSILLNTKLTRVPRPKSLYWQLALVNGARLSARNVELRGHELRATTLAGGEVTIPVLSLATLQTRQGKAIYLSDLRPLHYEHTPFLGVRWPLGIDRSVAGLNLCLAGSTYDKGIGVHSRSRFAYGLPNGSRRFEAIVGLDEHTGRLGNVQIQAEIDGKPVFDPPIELSGSDPPKPLRVALPTGARELTLLVDYGRGGDVQDHVNWAEARIISER